MVIDVSLAPRRLTRPALRAVDASPDRRPAVTSLLVVATILALLAGVALPSPALSVAYASLVPIVVTAGLFLSARQMAGVFGAVLMAALALSVVGDHAMRDNYVGGLLVTMTLLMLVDHRRSRAGVPQAVGSSMLVDLRERLRIQGRLPMLPSGWSVESSVQAAHGDSFSGDFVVGNTPTPDRFEVALVDVSGKGTAAGTRSLLVRGAFAGLLGALEPDRFLPAANDYLVRQGWPEGFATAIHASIDLVTGDYTVGSAGHPAAVHFQAGCGQWTPVRGTSGVLLGVLEGQGSEDFPRTSGRLERGDALLLYSDGVIEMPGVDIMQGLDRMLGYADRAVATGLPGAAARICASARAGETDDRAVVLISRG
ncbi:PP2C family protein-serine/threonine phosphatase [Leekyejoonella antrihumi]|uniref:Serine/threonine-protein phosphatase n=1 Tax=Leekyejoonella antrihumi TaxID=1660198 RepID=A0A563E579_9MICO|nr:PP2C family protein-serine/threonine phosphatase [Leekyejoonella antrihumi]TWP37666.1 serine/threonine-protein phosphatase [Leekyejoonella antrihumi]